MPNAGDFISNAMTPHLWIRWIDVPSTLDRLSEKNSWLIDPQSIPCHYLYRSRPSVFTDVDQSSVKMDSIRWIVICLVVWTVEAAPSARDVASGSLELRLKIARDVLDRVPLIDG